MDSEYTYQKISDKDFIKRLENALKDANGFCEKLQQEKDNLIKYLENKICLLPRQTTFFYERDGKTITETDIKIEVYKDILERIKSGKYE